MEPSGGDSGGVSPLRSSPAAAFCLSVPWFCVSTPPLFAKRHGTFFIGVFRSRRSRWTKDRRPRSSEVETSWAHAAMYFRPRGTLPFPACWASGLQFKPIAFVSKILNRALWPCPFWSPEAPGKSETLKKTFSGKTGLIPNKWENYEVFPKSL